MTTPLDVLSVTFHSAGSTWPGAVLGGVIYKIYNSLLFGKTSSGVINMIRSVIILPDLVQLTIPVCVNSDEE